MKGGKGFLKENDSYDKLRFEGDYLNGKRNGKGKEFYNGSLIFEGIFLYGHKLKGKEYIEEKLEYEGEYLYDKKWNGKGYDNNGKIIYELNNGNGKVKEYTLTNLALTAIFNTLKKFFRIIFLWVF